MDMALQKNSITRLALAATVTALALTACGGGGSSGTPAGQTEVRRAQPAVVMSNMAPGLTLFAGYTGGSGTLDGTGTSARFTGPVGIAIDAADNLYVTDERSSPTDLVLRKITPGGVVTTSSAPGSQHSTFDRAGNRYIAVGSAIVKVAPDGTTVTLAGVLNASGLNDGSGADARFSGIGSMASDLAGNLYVTNTKFTCPMPKPVYCINEGGVIRKISPAGVVTTIAGAIVDRVEAVPADGTGTAARFAQLSGLVVDNEGNLFVTDSGSIRRISPSGDVTTLPADPAVSESRRVQKVVVGADNSLLALALDKVFRVAPSGVMTQLAEFSSANLGLPPPFTAIGVSDLVRDSAGNLFGISGRNAV